MTVRACSMFDMDDQCGIFKFMETNMKGCVLTCNYNGCNGTNSLNSHSFVISIVVLCVLIWLQLAQVASSHKCKFNDAHT